MNSGHLLIVQIQLQEQAQEKDAEINRQQRELQTLTVRNSKCIYFIMHV